MRYPCWAMAKKPRAEQVNVRLSAEERKALEKLAEKERRTPSDTVRVLIMRAAQGTP